jgi:hypothetical protein
MRIVRTSLGSWAVWAVLRSQPFLLWPSGGQSKEGGEVLPAGWQEDNHSERTLYAVSFSPRRRGRLRRLGLPLKLILGLP